MGTTVVFPLLAGRLVVNRGARETIVVAAVGDKLFVSERL